MPRVHQLKANKDYPAIGVKKGETYFKWKRRHGPTQRSKTYPRPTQLSNAKTARIREAIDDALVTVETGTDADDIKTALESVAEVAREVADEYQESYDAMSDSFPNGCPKMEEMEEKKDACESFADSCEMWEPDTELPDYEEGDEEKGTDELKQQYEEALGDLRDSARGVLDEFEL